MTPTPEKPKRKFVPIKLEPGAQEITCRTCQHHGGTSIDDVAPICWDCVHQGLVMGGILPYWSPKGDAWEPKEGEE